MDKVWCIEECLGVVGPLFCTPRFDSTIANDFWRCLLFQCKHFESELNQSVAWSSLHTVGNEYFEAVTLIWSPSTIHKVITISTTLLYVLSLLHIRFNSILPRPSKLAQAVFLELNGTQMRSSIESGTNVGLNESVCGQIGVIKIARISGWVREPLADSYG